MDKWSSVIESLDLENPNDIKAVVDLPACDSFRPSDEADYQKIKACWSPGGQFIFIADPNCL